MSANEA